MSIESQRPRQPGPPRFLHPPCGYDSAIHGFGMALYDEKTDRDDGLGPEMKTQCPFCGAWVDAIRPRPAPVSTIQAVREADFTADEIARLREILASALSDAHAEHQAVEEIPSSAPVVRAARSEAGSRWRGRLASVLTAVALVMGAAGGAGDAVSGIAQVVRDDEPQVVVIDRTSKLSDDDIDRIAQKVSADLYAKTQQSTKRPPPPPRKAKRQRSRKR